ncbi:MAG TPA: lysylphosphatidylglycerol synthase domain-containing protein [Solirubrobacteraceae bacterium]|nr:lysylphosphatidylglycerol synthase domain-containing protein [Solirubrobacteraceae bacterium]
MAAGKQGRGSAPGGVGAPSLRSKRVILSILLAISAIVGMYLIAGSLEGFSRTARRLGSGSLGWLLAAGALELASIGGYAVLFWSVIARDVPKIGWRASVQIPLAGIAALRLLATGGAGGFAVTAWALRRAGMTARMIGTRMIAALVIEYSLYLLSLVVFGFGLWAGLFVGGGSFALTLLPAAISLALIAIVLGFAALPLPGSERRDAAGAPREEGGTPARPIATLRARLLVARQTAHAGVRAALSALSLQSPDLRSLGMLGALAYWFFDIAVLWCSFRAFVPPPAVAVVVMGYFLGTFGSLLPLAGGVGGVEGGMFGVFVAFGVQPAHALLGVLTYRLISFWLPTLPGVAGYLGLRRTVHGWESAARESAQQERATAGSA